MKRCMKYQVKKKNLLPYILLGIDLKDYTTDVLQSNIKQLK